MKSTDDLSQKTTEELHSIVCKQSSKIVDLEVKLQYYEEQFRSLTHKRFGASSEKCDAQSELFNEVESILAEDESDTVSPVEEDGQLTITYTRKKPGRKPLPKDLPREQIRYELSEEEQICGCGHHLHEMGEDKSEQLEIIPAQVKVIEHIRVKYACRHCDNGIKTASKPAQPIEKSIASASLLAHIAVAKYTDALPLYRQEAIFKRLNIDINRTSMANWMIKISQLTQPLIQSLMAYQMQQNILQADETPLQVVNEPGRDAKTKSYMWLYQTGSSGGSSPPVVIYDYQPGRSGLYAKKYLKDYTGKYLQTDGYSGYAQVCTPVSGIVSVGCWAHARRKFDEVIKALPKSQKNKSGKAQMAINTIAKLYAIEKQCREITPEQRYLIRQEKSQPILNQFKKWLDKSVDQVPPKQLLGKAIHYALNQWQQLIQYIENGELDIDNNAAERRIKPFVIGRKNWLFSQTPKGAQASATLYSLIETAKANALEPQAYLKYILTELPKFGRHAEPDEIAQLLPWNCSEKIRCLQ
ncbi:MAG: IS66 family transposase [Gammaproteobacteria bacterium]|nr:IS66 family transposase [Gammaproteobacteria bacterium]